MNICVGQLISDAKDLVLRLKERENNLDQVVLQTNSLTKRVDAIQQLESEFIKFNESAQHKSKAAVLNNIQKENRVIKMLQQENEELKESLEEHQSVLELIMTKYREQMLKLILLKNEQTKIENLFKSNLMKNLQEKTDQISEMVGIMQESINIDENVLNENEEKLQSLLVENRGLRELLQIKNKYNPPTHPPPPPSVPLTNDSTSSCKVPPPPTPTTTVKKEDKEVQTTFNDSNEQQVSIVDSTTSPTSTTTN